MIALMSLLLACDGGAVDDTESPDTGFERGDLRIMSLVADNVSGDVDEAGQFDDWVLLQNEGSASYTLSGLSLTDSHPDKVAWSIPETTLEAGAELRIWCDNDPTDGDYHADFKLSKTGETLTLLDGEQIVDQVTWPALDPDQVYAWNGTEWSVQE